MDKLTLAHEINMANLKHSTCLRGKDIEALVEVGFNYAEAMLAEEEKRKDKSRPAVIEKVDNVDWVDDFTGVDWNVAPIFANWWAVDSNGDASLHVIDGENDGVPEEWLLVPIDADIAFKPDCGGISFTKTHGS